jgi:hypothetical protein
MANKTSSTVGIVAAVNMADVMRQQVSRRQCKRGRLPFF